MDKRKTKAKSRHKEGSVSKRLTKSYVTILSIMIVCIAISIAALLKVSSDYKFAIENYGFAQGYAGELGIEFNTMTTNLRSLILETDEAEIENIVTAIDENRENIDVYLKKVSDSANTQEEQQLVSEMEEAIGVYRDIRTQVVDLAAANKNTEAYDLLKTDGVQYAEVIKNNIKEVLTINIDKCNETVGSARLLSVIMIIVIVAMAALSVLVGMKLAGSISRSICVPLEEVKNAAEKLKNGNLDIEISFESEDEIGVLAESFRNACEFMRLVIRDTSRILDELASGNFCVTSECLDAYIGEFQSILLNMRGLRDQMNGALMNIQEASNQVAAGSGQMAESAQSLAEGATEQAGAVEELMATIENVSAMVDESASNAEKSYKQAQEFAGEAEKSNDAMTELTDAMESINETSQQIGNIIAEIEDIASQTNLLSLNAAIEAARAGEAGKGFAVVADQISKLASESSKSAVNTRELIENSIAEIEKGNQITAKTSEVLKNVVTGVQMLGESARENSSSAAAQAESVKQIAEGIEQISSVVQNNSATAEETSAASEELSAQAESLNEEINKFQLLEQN